MKGIRGALILLSFALLPALFLWKLTLGGRILVGGDPLNFFYPYHDGVVAALSEGRLPQWNPYLFGGVPFLADPQAQFFYPPAWLLWRLDAPSALTWSAVLHAAIAGTGVYAWARRALALHESGAWVAGLLFALGGYAGAQIEHVNQIAAAAWLPWLYLGYERARAPDPWLAKMNGVALGGAALGMSLLAGHAQTTFIGLFLLALWSARCAIRAWMGTRGMDGGRGEGRPDRAVRGLRAAGATLIPVALLGALGTLIAAVQLLPTQSLSALSTRASGLDLREAAAFSFDPRIALRAFLPTYGLDDAVLSEYVAWVGFGGLALAAVGAWRGRGAGRDFGLLAAVTGLLLAPGAYSPFFWLFWRFVPGFDLFRVPARWLLLWALGAAVLAGVGLEVLSRREKGEREPGVALNGSPRSGAADARRRSAWAWAAALALFAVALSALFLVGDMPRFAVLPAWAGAAGITGVLLIAGWRSHRNGTGAGPHSIVWVGWIVVELALASWGQPYQGATAPEAYSGMRPTVAHLLAATYPPLPADGDNTASGPETGQGRVLSLSNLTWDPGDLARLQDRYAGRLSEESVYDLVVATKLKEVLAPNQPMRWRLPGADGYGGGLLPSARWVSFQAVLPLAKLVPDGRLREQLTGIPRRELLDIMGVEWLVADKVMDWWSEGIYHDLGAPREMRPSEQLSWQPPAGNAFMPMDALSFIVGGTLPPDAGVLVLGERVISLNRAEARAVRETARGEERHYLLPLEETVSSMPAIEIRVGKGAWMLSGLTVWNSRLQGFEALAADPVLRTTSSGDVKVYRRADGLGHAWFAATALFARDAESAAAAIADPAFEPAQAVVIEGAADLAQTGSAEGTVAWVSDQPERIELAVDSATGGWLVLAHAPFPGWRVTIDGSAGQWFPANVINRAVYVPAGTHTVVWEYETPALGWGIAASALGLIVMVALALLSRKGAQR